MESLRIALALPGLHRVPRGAETAFEQLARELAIQGHRVTVFGSGPPQSDQPYRYVEIPCTPREAFENWPKFPVFRTNYAWEEFSFARTLIRRYRPRDFDLAIGCSYPFTNWVLQKKDHGARSKHVFVTQNGDWMLRAHNAEYAYFHCDALVCTNPVYYQQHRGRFPAALIPNGVDTQKFSPGKSDRASFGLPENGPVVLMTSALIPSKRVLEGIRAAAAIPDLFLVIAGDGPMRREVDREAERLLPGRFKRFTVPRENMPQLYRSVDLFLHTSREEPSANVYLEALATGLPIVAHDWSVTQWTLEDCAILVDTDDEAKLVEGLKRALRENRPDQVASRRALAHRRFNWNAIGQCYSEFFESVLKPLPTISAPPRQGALGDVGVVAIGRNEGERLQRCLASLRGKVAAIVYVDSGSNDGSPRLASVMGAQVVYLDNRQGFTAARARNSGLDKLLQVAPNLTFVQFIDGDCEVRDGWLETARAYLKSRDDLAAVCGRRTELHASRTIYNRIIDLEWNTPVGPAKSCGGDSLMKIDAVRNVGSFDPSVMAGEEPELCLRLRNAGYRIWRIDADMTVHDSAIRKYKQLWWRQVRSGYGAMDVFNRFGQNDRLFASQVQSARIWGLAVPLLIIPAFIFGLLIGPIMDTSGIGTGLFLSFCVVLLWGAQVLKLALSSLHRGRDLKLSLAWAWFTMLGKFAGIHGQWRWRKDFKKGSKPVLIEYKQPGLSMVVVSKEVKA